MIGDFQSRGNFPSVPRHPPAPRLRPAVRSEKPLRCDLLHRTEGHMEPCDEIARIESEGIQKTHLADWPAARALFAKALTFDMPALRRAQILRNVALTYIKEGNRSEAQKTSQQAVETLDEASTGSHRAEQLRNELLNLETYAGGRLPLPIFWYWVAFFAGLYWGMSFASGATFANGAAMTPMLVFAIPVLMCLGVASVVLRGLNSRSLLAAVTLFASFAFTFVIGYAVSSSGLIRLGYHLRKDH